MTPCGYFLLMLRPLKILNFLVIALMNFFKICGPGQSKKMEVTKNKQANKKMKKVRRIKQKTALPVQTPLEILTFT